MHTNPTTWIAAGLASLMAVSSSFAQPDPAFLPGDYFKASNTRTGDRFGSAVALDGDTLVVGAPEEDSGATGIDGSQTDSSAPDSGAVYVLVRTNGQWRQQAYIKASNTGAGDRFGSAVALHDDTLVVGAPEEDSAATGVDGSQSDNSASNSGAVYLFTRSNGQWQQQAYIKASNTGARDRFGTVVAIGGDAVLVGAPEEDSNASGLDGNQDDNSSVGSGAAYLFRRSGSDWIQQHYVKASNSGAGDRFGTAVAVDRAHFAVGAPGEGSDARGVDGDQDNNRANDSGAVYVFERPGNAWRQQSFIKSTNSEAGDGFGWAVALSAGRLAAGAVGEDSNAVGVGGDQGNNASQDSGAVFVFVRNTGGWSPQAYIKASNTDPFDFFGQALALQRERLVVGAQDEDSNATGIDGDGANNAATDSGAAWSYHLASEGWQFGNYLKASNTERLDRFGFSVALSDGKLVVGASGEESAATGLNGNTLDNSAPGAGAAFEFIDASGLPPSINAGLNDAWFDRNQAGQGAFVNVFPDLGVVFLALFTFDAAPPDPTANAVVGATGHRWLTAIGPYAGNEAVLDVELTTGGIFDQSPPVPVQAPGYGTWELHFNDCNSLTLAYDFPGQGLAGVMEMTRVVADNIVLCRLLGLP